ncbi:indole-3-glycerol phosphate synthase TrpC [Psychroflexus lacisalsi]|jgi:indole-3-glycerol phosphate synthase|uniref:indole-3-glycerol-phosphate synthase n=1 Tax=Psychroflexus lacisalsi TaxID=503928 RepID=A0ABP3VMR7_9FLAO|nr:indole-3-glycerol phosphate synthase TrpC [Psychroflexus lacisalsi]MBZ9620450.1 indole-3-glycerol phosphate synthase TrpC [Psychroflexus lacisalsi]
MKQILEEIIGYQQLVVNLKKKRMPVEVLTSFPEFSSPTRSLKQAVATSEEGIIAEFKRRSPSKEAINLKADVMNIAQSYEKMGAAGMSVLTNQRYFGGSLEDLQLAKSVCNLPILRKDFMVDAYQVLEAKAYGADAILLIANALSAEKLEELAVLAHDLGLEILFEIHEAEEIKKLDTKYIDLIGVNNRNLRTFEVDLQQGLDMLPHLPADVLKISESGIQDRETIQKLIQQGFNGVLVGEFFMKQNGSELK